jgi:phage-related protein
MRRVVFEADTLARLREFPETARQRAGYEIDRIQRNLEAENWKAIPTIGQGVREIRIQVGRQFRVFYIAKFPDRVHVLHVFEKKSQQTRQSDIALAKSRLQEVIRRHSK